MIRPDRSPIGAEPLLTAADVAALLRISRAAVYQLRRKADELPCYEVGGALRWRRADVERWLEGRRGREGEALLTTVDVAALLGVSVATAYRRLRWEIPCRELGGALRFKREDVERWLEERPRGAWTPRAD